MSLLDYVGNTPLYEIKHSRSQSVKLFAKLEWFNPGGSVKDRAAKGMLKEALKKKWLTNKILIEATSGNTGISLAMFCASFNIPIEIALPENASIERKRILKNYGAQIHLTDPLMGTDGAQNFVKDIVTKNPDKYYYPDQYNNPANWQAHYQTTGPEIWSQSNHDVTHFVAGLGTTGSFIGTSRYLKQHNVECIEVHPDNPMHGLEGWKHLPSVIVPQIYDDTVADKKLEVSTEDAFTYAKAASRFLGLQISPSSAANLCASLKVVQELDSGVVVTLFPDNGNKYLNDSFWEDDDYDIEDPFI